MTTTPELRFPESAEDLSDAFNNALASGAMQRDRRDLVTWWGRFELIASEYQDGVLIADEFINTETKEFVRVSRKDGSE